MKITILLVLLLLAACSPKPETISPDLINTAISQTQIAQTISLSAIKETSTPIPTTLPVEEILIPSSCGYETAEYLKEIQPLGLEFGDAINVAGSTPRISLSPIIQDMQRIRREIADIPVPDCAQQASSLWISGIDNVINSFIDFLGDASDAKVSRGLEQGQLEITNGLDQLVALASGEPTSIPRKLPTSTPRPTPRPTSTPLPVGSSFVIGNWQIQVVKVETVEELSFYEKIHKAEGRFALLYLSVTNISLQTDSFSGLFGHIDIVDSNFIRYEEDDVASFEAQVQKNMDMNGYEVNPDETQTVLVVYDISKDGRYYFLEPGILEEEFNGRVILEIP